MALFKNNIAVNNGGAIYLQNSSISMHQGSVTFHNNTAKNGGALYIDGDSQIIWPVQAQLKFTGNIAVFYGAAVYVVIGGFTALVDQTIFFYYGSLSKAICCDDNIANMVGNCAYFDVEVYDYNCEYADARRIFRSDKLFTTKMCKMDFSNTTVTIEDTLYNYQDDTLAYEFPLHNLHFDVAVFDFFNNLVGPVYLSVDCYINRDNLPEYYIDSIQSNITLLHDRNVTTIGGLSTLTISFCAYGINASHLKGLVNADTDFTIMHVGTCNDDMSHILVQGVCLPFICAIIENLLFPSDPNYLSHFGMQCIKKGNTDYDDGYCNDNYSLTVDPGYWFSNGYQYYTVSCPIDHCDTSLALGDLYPFDDFNNSDVQCLPFWSGLICGDCNSSENRAILYDTTNCIQLKECFRESVAPNLLLLLSISFLYWFLVISFIFVLLHFQFNVIAGYAYGVIFYYSVLEIVITMLIKVQYIDKNAVQISLLTLPFLSNLGYLKVPFLTYVKLCLYESKAIDHVFISYIHPLIVTCLVGLIFITARRFIIVARYVGRYVNSKSICILLLLSYSSICYTSMQLLKPFAIFERDFTVHTWKWRTYLSPTVPYFHGRHILYGIIAILCELIIGIGLPLVILTQRYLIRYFNLKLISIKPVIDQLQGCYKEEYRWFAAYYLICRQVIYAADIFSDIVSSTNRRIYHYQHINYTFQSSDATVTTMFVMFSVMLFIHVWLRPYKVKGLNILDGIILITLLFLMISAANTSGSDDGITIFLFFLPLLLLLNYLLLSSKLKHIFIPGSCIGVIATELFLTNYYVSHFNVPTAFKNLWAEGMLHVYIVMASFICLVVYVIWVVKQLSTRCKREEYMLVNIQDYNGDDENSDST